MLGSVGIFGWIWGELIYCLIFRCDLVKLVFWDLDCCGSCEWLIWYVEFVLLGFGVIGEWLIVL